MIFGGVIYLITLFFIEAMLSFLLLISQKMRIGYVIMTITYPKNRNYLEIS